MASLQLYTIGKWIRRKRSRIIICSLLLVSAFLITIRNYVVSDKYIHLIQQLNGNFLNTDILGMDARQRIYKESLRHHVLHLEDVEEEDHLTSSTDRATTNRKFEDLDARVSKATQLDEPIIWRRRQQGATPFPFNSVELDRRISVNSYEEEFTIILLTHSKRISELPATLAHLDGLRNLNRVIIIWNGNKPPENSVKWPTVNYTYQIFSNGKNSLNNRFLPLDVIKTEAIFSMDDDMFPPHENIIFAFRVWQEYRDQIVGFPGRGVHWNGTQWEYTTRRCAVSLVLTGLAFFHKKYLNLYTYEMPDVIRKRVDNLTNCEDIAMNFLVSHLTQKPPIKLTPDNGWYCPTCNWEEKGKKSLWEDPSHFQERDECINYFAGIYGYVPLFKTEYRLDDNLAKTEPRACASRINMKEIPTTAYTFMYSNRMKN